jgi:hypothetical protein
VQVADSETNQQTAAAQLSITISAITITTTTLTAGNVSVPYAATLAAVGGVKPYTWTLSSGTLPSGLSLSSGGVISGTPTATGTSTFTVQVADSESTPATATAQLSLTISSESSPGSLSGSYAFYLNGFNSSGAWTLAGSFIADGNGNITSGVVDSNSVSGQPITDVAITGAYTIAANGLNTMTIQGSSSWGPMTLAFVLDSIGNGRIMEYDDTTGTGSRGAGALRKADSSTFSQGALSGGWVFGLTGAGASGERWVNLGQFTLATGAISDGTCDTNDGGAYSTGTFTGTLSSVDPQSGRATVTTDSSNGTSNEVVYVVSASEMVMEQVSPVQAGVEPLTGAGSDTAPLGVGSVLQQSGSFSNSSLNSTAVMYMQDINGESGFDQSQAGIISFDGNGNFNIIAMDEDSAGVITQDSTSQGTYTVGANGALALTCGGGECPAGYLIAENKALLIGTGSNTIFGMMEPQTGGPFSNASIAGTYPGGSLPPLDYRNAANELYVGAADGAGNVLISLDSSSSDGLNQGTGTITYTIASNGRGSAQEQGVQNPAVVYMISPTKWLMLMPETDARLGLFEQPLTSRAQQGRTSPKTTTRRH